MFGEIIQESFDDREKRILKLWEENHIFEKSVEKLAPKRRHHEARKPYKTLRFLAFLKNESQKKNI